MKNKEIETRIRRAFQKATPDVLASVLSDCETQKGTVIPMTNNKKKHFRWTAVAAMAAALALVVGLGFGFGAYRQNQTIISTVSLEVNPSVKLELNHKEKVLQAVALNADGEKILGSMDLTGSNLDVAVNALIGSMLKEGYLNELANSVLVSVKSKDSEKGTLLQKQLTDTVNALFSSDDFSGAVISQTLPEDQTIANLSQQYAISEGKAALIQKIMAHDSRYSFDTLSKLSINELNLLSVSGKHPLEGVASAGTASDKTYIGSEAAKQAALRHCGVAEDALWDLEIELDYDDGYMVYDVEFRTSDCEYEYSIDAKTGTVRRSETEKVSTPDQPASPIPTLSAQDVKMIALNHAGISSDSIRDYDAELEKDHGILIYDISFKTTEAEYEYDIHAITGDILAHDRKVIHTEDPPKIPEDPKQLTAEEAKQIALRHAGVSVENISDYECELEQEGAKTYFDISFECGAFDYDYEIDAFTGHILQCEKDRDDDVYDREEPNPPLPPATTPIPPEDAKAIALNHAMVNSQDVQELEWELDEENGKAVYEISFRVGSTEYEYEIDAVTGDILHHEKEHDD